MAAVDWTASSFHFLLASLNLDFCSATGKDIWVCNLCRCFEEVGWRRHTDHHLHFCFLQSAKKN